MDKSESIKELADALSKAQGQIKGAIKDSANPFFKSKYADLSSVVEAIRAPLATNGLSYVQVVHDAEGGAKIETLILHSSGEWLSCGAVSVPVSKADAQGFGSAMTYARRYSLSAAFGVAPEDDDGNAATAARPKAKNPAYVMSDTIEKQETPGQIVDLELALGKIESPEIRKSLQEEAKRIEVSFYTVGVKSALLRYQAFRKEAGDDEDEAMWAFMDSKARAGLKKALAA